MTYQAVAQAPEGGKTAMPDPMGHGKPPKESRRSLVAFVGVAVLCILWTLPTLGLLVTSFRDRTDATQSGWWTILFNPGNAGWTFDNYKRVFEGTDLGTGFINSLVVAIPATVIPIMFAAFAAYAFTFMEFRGKDVLFVTIVALLVIPIQVAFQPMLNLLGPRGLGITQQYFAVWLLHTGFGMPLAIYTLRNYMATLPKTVIESAKIDGATHFQTFFKLVLPMSVPALASFAIFQFLWVWNDLLVALIFLGPTQDVAPITVAVKNNLLGQQGAGWNLITAGGFLSMVLPIIVFLALQRFFVRGLTAGAVKG